jgi:hypothetical protein
MNTRTGHHDDGFIGLGILILMTVALVAGQLHGTSDRQERLSDVPLVGPHLLIDDEGEAQRRIGGAIRELRVLPSAISDYAQLDWSADEELIRDFRRPGL